jgi:NAD(P)-dependent dehydrogenase (short-subunit alcohol dehydrogenase family)
MERVLVIGASGGIGSALCSALGSKGFVVIRRSRSADGFDVTDEAAVARGLEGLSGLSGVIVASGALEIGGAQPEKSVKAISARAMADQFALNAIGPALILKHAPNLLRRDARSVFAVLSARVGSIGDNRTGGWISYRAAKAAVNQVVRTGALELARTHPHAICVALHPGTVKTAFTEKYLGRHPAVEPAEAAENLLRVIAGRTPRHSGMFFDWAGKEVPW